LNRWALNCKLPVLNIALRILVTGLLLLGTLLSARAASPGLRHSKHNLALGDPGKVAVASESEMCNFCHTPHGSVGEKALWSHSLSTATYTPYTSTTMKAAVGQPTGESKLCLSCHDGTVALGLMHRQKPNASARLASVRMTPGRAVLGTDLSDDHPVSFSYDAALAAGAQLKEPALLNNLVRLDARGQVQCTSCHDPHNDANGMFLVQNNYASALCLNCHVPNLWTGSAHRNSTRTWNGTGRDPWPHTSQTTVLGNGCENCHTPHNAGTHQRLLNLPQAEDNCLVCHNGSVAAKNVASEFNKPSVHPVLTTASLHDEAEELVSSKNRHASCVDCHNPHAANATPRVRPNAGGTLAGVAGVNASGVVVKDVTREYELCFRCHADRLVRGSKDLLRQWPEPNLRLQFATVNTSFHPVEAAGKNGNVPSLIRPWNISSLVYCTDCHNNDQGPGALGSGPNGPHGSLYAPLLERELIRADFNSESYGIYAMCYKCHDRNSILADQSFKASNSLGQDRGHRYHIVDAKASCTTCHASHGVQGQARLINFNTLYVTPSSNGRIEFNTLGMSHGNCSLTCHGGSAGSAKDHNRTVY